MTALSDIRTQMDQTSGAIDAFRRSVADGTPIDLAGLDKSIDTMCDAIAKLPPDERVDLKRALITLMNDMDTLVASLQEQRATVSQDLNGVSSRQQAVSAYGKGGTPAIRKGEPGK